MSRTFVQLCRDVVSDLGIAGGALQSTTGQLNLEQTRIINWVARADLVIQNLWADWSFLWFKDTAVIAQAASSSLAVTLPTWAAGVQSINDESLWQDYGTTSARRVPFMPWDRFSVTYQSRAKATAARPSCFSRSPTGQLWLSQNVSVRTVFCLEYWCIGSRMATDNSTSPIPNNFDMLICERAKMFYAQRENAPEIMSGSTAEFIDGLDKMQAFCLPNNTAARRLSNGKFTTPDAYVE